MKEYVYYLPEIDKICIKQNKKGIYLDLDIDFYYKPFFSYDANIHYVKSYYYLKAICLGEL